MTASAHPDLPFLVESAAVEGERRYTLLGEVREDVGATAPPALSPFANLDAYRGDTSDEAITLVPFLAAEIYVRLYSRAPSPVSATSDILVLRDFTAALSRANCGSGGWEQGWTVAGVDGKRVVVKRREVSFWAQPDDVRPENGELAPSKPCRVRVGKEFRHLVPGFYTALGDAWPRGGSDGPRRMVRIYWSLARSGAVPFIELTTRTLNRAQIPFRAKVLSDPAHYVRADAGVAYVDAQDFDACSSLLRRIADELRPHLGADPPRLTKALWPGVGLAEDPGVDSFGLSRSKLLGCALWSCWQHGISEPSERLSHVIDFFAAAGIDPERPYLDRGGHDRYLVDDEVDVPALDLAEAVRGG